jgi:hypothetical protein
MRIFSVFGVVTFVAMVVGVTPALASQGQLGLEAAVSNELAILHHPDAGYQNARGAFTYVPRLGASLVYGLRNRWDLALGCEVSLERDVVARHVAFQSHPSGDLYAAYRDILVPLRLAYRTNVGGNVRFIAMLAGGVVFSHWQDRYMLPSGAPDAPATVAYFINKADPRWHRDLFGRVSLGGEWQALDWLTLAATPYVGYATNKNVYIGAIVYADFLFGVGGFWDPL